MRIRKGQGARRGGERVERAQVVFCLQTREEEKKKYFDFSFRHLASSPILLLLARLPAPSPLFCRPRPLRQLRRDTMSRR